MFCLNLNYCCSVFSILYINSDYVFNECLINLNKSINNKSF